MLLHNVPNCLPQVLRRHAPAPHDRAESKVTLAVIISLLFTTLAVWGKCPILLCSVFRLNSLLKMRWLWPQGHFTLARHAAQSILHVVASMHLHTCQLSRWETPHFDQSSDCTGAIINLKNLPQPHNKKALNYAAQLHYNCHYALGNYLEFNFNTSHLCVGSVDLTQFTLDWGMRWVCRRQRSNMHCIIAGSLRCVFLPYSSIQWSKRIKSGKRPLTRDTVNVPKLYIRRPWSQYKHRNVKKTVLVPIQCCLWCSCDQEENCHVKNKFFWHGSRHPLARRI